MDPEFAELFADVTPVLQNDGPNPLVPIDYSPGFREIMDYFRALLQNQECSQRALQLTERVIDMNPANYTAWQYRRTICEGLGVEWGEELEYVNSLAYDNPKNYQIWHHRRFVVNKMASIFDLQISHTLDENARFEEEKKKRECGKQELLFLEEYLTDVDLDDAKNYHVWGHRQWVLDRFDLWGAELTFVDKLLKLDVRNNSAWNERFVAIEKTTGWTPEVIAREIDVALSLLEIDRNNESPWSYIRGILRGKSMSQHVPDERILPFLNPKESSRFAVEFLADLAIEQQRWDKAESLFLSLETDLDPFRVNYWRSQRENVQKLRQAASSISA